MIGLLATVFLVNQVRNFSGAGERINEQLVDIGEVPGRANNAADRGPFQPLAIGETATSDFFEVTLLRVDPQPKPRNRMALPQAGKRFVAAQFRMKNTSDQDRPTDARDMTLLTSANEQYDIDLNAWPDPGMPELVPAGEERIGWVAFSIPSAVTSFRIEHNRLRWELTV